MIAFVSAPAGLAIHPSGWLKLAPGRWITKRPLWDRAHDCPARPGVGPAREWCRQQRPALRLPMAAEYEELHQRALFIEPVTLPTAAMITAAGVPRPWGDATGRDTPQMRKYRADNMRTREWCRIHDDEVCRRADAAGYNGSQALANDGKHQDADGDIIGWWKAPAPATAKIQNESGFHRAEPNYTDYATNVHVCYDGEAPPSDGCPDTDPEPKPPAPTRPDVSTLPGAPTRPGDPAERVRAWQRWLLAHGYALPRFGADGDHGAETERATQAALRDHPELADLWRNGTGEPEELPLLPFRQARYFHPTRRSGSILWIVIHTAETLEVSGGALALQKYAATMPDGRVASWHDAIDDRWIAPSVRVDQVAFAAPGANARGIQIELCGKAGQGVVGWGDPYSQAELALAARRVAQYCRDLDIPVRHVGPTEMRAGEAGICAHADVTKGVGAGKTSHVDPGVHFPWQRFLEMVRSAS